MNDALNVEYVEEFLWVYVEVAGSCRYGRLSRKHYEAVLNGNYTARFLALEDTFWLNESRVVRASQRGIAPEFEGTFHIHVPFITTIAPVDNCTKLFLPFFPKQGEGQSAWERQQELDSEVMPIPPKPRNRKVPL
jgi:hypothetical protein